MQGVNWTAWQGVILGEEELEDFFVGEAAVGKQSDNAGDKAVGIFLLGAQEGFWDIADAIALDGDQLVFADHIHHLGHHNV